jgi:hypothetical protein
MATQTLATADAILKDLYVGPIIEQLNYKTFMLDQIERDSDHIDFTGRRAIVPVHARRNRKRGSIVDGGTLPVPGYQSDMDAIVGIKYHFQGISLTEMTIKQADRQRGLLRQRPGPRDAHARQGHAQGHQPPGLRRRHGRPGDPHRHADDHVGRRGLDAVPRGRRPDRRPPGQRHAARLGELITAINRTTKVDHVGHDDHDADRHRHSSPSRATTATRWTACAT